MSGLATVDGLTPEPTSEQHDEQLKLRFFATRCEPNLAAPFFARGGQLGSAVARDETFFAVSGSVFATGTMVNETASVVEIDLPPSLYRRDLATGAVQLSTRSRLNVSACRVGAAINGTVTQTLSGQGTVPIYELFTEAMGGAAKEDAGTTATATATARIRLPFQQVPLKYASWGAHSAVMSVYEPQIVALDPKTGKHTAPQDVQFVQSPALDVAMAKSEPALQAIYNASWELRKHLVYPHSPNLTKSVMRVPAGFNASGYALAASVNDIPVSHSDAALESVLYAALAAQLSQEEHTQLLEDLATPSVFATQRHAQALATAMSVHSAVLMPYRVDGTPVVTPKGIEMVQAESWRWEASHGADDCDGSAANTIAVINAAVKAEEAEPGKYPHLRALANSLGAHYVAGVSVLGATSGHADSADETATKLAGHAVAIAIPKVHFLAALERGGHGTIGGEVVIPPEDRAAVANARFNALYPTSLVAKMPTASVAPSGQVLNEQKIFSSFDTIKMASMTQFGANKLQPLAMEGTTPASSMMYEHDASDRHERGRVFALDKKLGERFSPNVARMHKVLDSGTTGKHAFYSDFVELSVSPRNGLFTSDALREKSMATAHFAFAKPTPMGPMSECGATPRDLATGEYAVVPLWRVGTEMARVVDAAHAEAVLDALPRRERPPTLTATESGRFNESIDALKALGAKIHTDAAEAERPGHVMQHFFSEDSLLRNPEAIKHFCEVVGSQVGTRDNAHGNYEHKIIGDVTITPLDDVLRSEEAGDVGVLASVTLWVKE